MRIRYISFGIFSAVLLFSACTNHSSTPEQTTKTEPDVNKGQITNKFDYRGHWLPVQFLEMVKHPNDTATIAGKYDFSEIVISGEKPDSVKLIHEDMESGDLPVVAIKSDTLIVRTTPKLTSNIIANTKNNTIRFRFDERYQEATYFKAPDSLFGKKGLSTFRYIFNMNLFKNKLYTTTEHGKEKSINVHFSPDGTVTGLDDFKKYHIYLAGDMANGKKIDIIGFTRDKKAGVKNFKTTVSYGIKFGHDAITLYTLKNLSAKNEKPVLAADRVYMKLQTAKTE